MKAGNLASADGTIDCDGYILEPPDLWETYLEPRYRERAIRIPTNDEGLEYFEFDGKPSNLIHAEHARVDEGRRHCSRP